MIFEERIDLYIDKKKVLVYLLPSLGFILLSIWMITKPGSMLLFGLVQVSHLSAGIIAMGIFAMTSYAFIRKLMRKLPVIVIDEKGIYDYTTSASGIAIPWEAVYDAEIRKVSMRQRIVVLSLDDAEAFIEQLPSGYRKKVAKINYNSVGSPATINATGLTIKPQELVALLKERIEAQNKPVQ